MDDEESTDQWAEIHTARFLDNQKLNLPLKFQFLVLDWHEVDDLIVHWHLDREAEVIVISNSILQQNRYTYHKHLQFYETPKEIRLPSGLINSLGLELVKGDTLVYLATKNMIGNSPRSLFLLTESQCFSLFDDDPYSDQSRSRSLKSAIPR